VPGVALGVLIQILGSLRGVPAGALSAAVLGAAAVFFAVVVRVSSITAAEDANWFIGPFPEGTSPKPLTPSELGAVDWAGLFGRPGGIAAVVAVSLVAVLLNLSGLEALTRDRLDTKRELGSAGVANILIAPFASVPGFHALGDTTLARQMGARSTAVPIGIAGLSLVAAFFGSALVGLTPRVIAGGLLIAVGLALLVNWAQSMRFTASRVERVLSSLIVLSIAAVGILEGITFGLVAACLIFVVRYSRIDPVKLETTAGEVPSRVVRTTRDREILDATADTVVVYQLSGYQFFGSFASVVERIRTRAEAATPPLRSVIIDFRHVSGIDSSTFTLLDQIARDLSDLDVQLIISDLAPSLEANLHTPAAITVEALDFALELAENLLLTSPTSEAVAPTQALASLSADLAEPPTRPSIPAATTSIQPGSARAA